MTRDGRLPHLSRIDFYRLHEGELISALAQAIRHIEPLLAGALPPADKAICAWTELSRDVPNGGFEQFFYNNRGDDGVEELALLLDSLDVPKAGPLLRDAVAVYRRHQLAFRVKNPWDGLFGSVTEFDKLERAFVNLVRRSDRVLEKWIRSHVTELATDETGNPIDAQFTGAVEIRQSNGILIEYLEVKKGKPSGAYREFFDDGTVRKVAFYKAGKVSGDFWPDGRLKRKESRRGPHTIIEWYYPSGRLQKRFIKGKDGYATEPVRLYHENGQLAEEVHTAGRERCGPWLKFFDDGSPLLHADYTPDAKLVIHNAWATDRTQTVKNGAGVFHDDGRAIDWEHAVFFERIWSRDQDLKEGVPHGKTTTYDRGVLWSVSFYVNGVEEGESTTFWDNGRIRSIAKMIGGNSVQCQSFPKFDRPTPAVVLRVEANEKLYTAWSHVRVDEYPQVLNLANVQTQLQVPDFLREVHERNQTGTTRNEYENCNTFNDGIAYFLTVSATGEVVDIRANGSGVYSGGSWGTYPPLLRQLRFRPGRILKRAVECRVLAMVDHTFVEGEAQENQKNE
jgi:antitoxin component YwqK of YwqJK toxin-antitoxin module